jgi:hypothetical protein
MPARMMGLSYIVESTMQAHAKPDTTDTLPASDPVLPATNHIGADEKMNDDTGLSNTANRQKPIDQGSRQAAQSNVGRRDDGTPD